MDYNQQKYIGEYNDDIYNLIINNNIKAKEIKKIFEEWKKD